jgi:beta-glucosidase
MPSLPFPPGFLWGAATSSHQVEGNNTLNDWYTWEKRVQPAEKWSGLASDQWNRWEEDVELKWSGLASDQ